MVLKVLLHIYDWFFPSRTKDGILWLKLRGFENVRVRKHPRNPSSGNEAAVAESNYRSDEIFNAA